MRLRLILAALLLAFPAHAATPAGLWWTQDHDGIIEILPCGDHSQLCGRIAGQPHILDEHGQPPRDNKGRLECGLTILNGKPGGEPGHWFGLITNPEDGQDWRSEFWLGEDGNLRLRGYILIRPLGQTQTWTRFSGRVAQDCTITGG